MVNARDALWLHNDMRAVCRFGGEGEAHFDDLRIGLYWLQPGQPMSLDHRGQRDGRQYAVDRTDDQQRMQTRSAQHSTQHQR